MPSSFQRFGRGAWRPASSGEQAVRKQARNRQQFRERPLVHRQVPNLRFALVIGHEEVALVGKKSCPGHQGEVSQGRRQRFPALGIPNPRGLVQGGRHHPAAIRTEGSSAHLVLMFERWSQWPACGAIPNNSREVCAGGDDSLAVRAEGHGANPGPVIQSRADGLAVDRTIYLGVTGRQEIVRTARCQILVIRAESRVLHRLRVWQQIEDGSACERIPNPDLAAAYRRDFAAVVAETACAGSFIERQPRRKRQAGERIPGLDVVAARKPRLRNASSQPST